MGNLIVMVLVEMEFERRRRVPPLNFDGEAMLIDGADHEAEVETEPQNIGVNKGEYYNMFDNEWWSVGDEDIKNIFKVICSYLSFEEMKKLRLMSSRLNMLLLNEVPHFYSKCRGTIKTSFYKGTCGSNPNISIRLNEASFVNFLYYRHHDLFKNYWQMAASQLETLELKNCSLECVGFKFILDFAPNLNKLTIKYCKLRDLDNYHFEPMKVTTDRPEKIVPENIGIKSLHFEGMTVIEICFMSYLLERVKSNNLIELSMAKCFDDKAKLGRGEIPAKNYFDCFAPQLVNLIIKNSKSLKKLTLKENSFQMLLLRKLTEKSDALKLFELTHFSVGLLTPVLEERNWNHLAEFIRQRCQKLENLAVQVVDIVKSEDIQSVIQMLISAECALKSFKFEMNCDVTAEKIHLKELINKLTHLEQLVVTDIKVLDSDVNYMSGGLKSLTYKLHASVGLTPTHYENLVAKSITNIDPSFLAELPGTIRNLCINRLVPETNIWLDFMNNSNFSESFKNLVKLQICGPYIHSMHMVIPKIVALINLETLILTNCGIHDTDISELNEQALEGLRRCISYGLSDSLSTIGNSKTRETFDAIIKGLPNFPVENSMDSSPNRKLSCLPKLKYLDLSDNPQITDATIYYSMRLPLVENLVLDNCSGVTDNGLNLIGMNFPSLRTLNVKNCPKISGFGLNEVIRSCKNLRRIYTTRVRTAISQRKLHALNYTLNPSFNDIVCTVKKS